MSGPLSLISTFVLPFPLCLALFQKDFPHNRILNKHFAPLTHTTVLAHRTPLNRQYKGSISYLSHFSTLLYCCFCLLQIFYLLVVCLTTLSVNQAIQRRMIKWWQIRKRKLSGSTQSRPTLRYFFSHLSGGTE